MAAGSRLHDDNSRTRVDRCRRQRGRDSSGARERRRRRTRWLAVVEWWWTAVRRAPGGGGCVGDRVWLQRRAARGEALDSIWRSLTKD
uniref:Uncharacterized protein n=1 Tax=Oryza sativa subsp. japonica TaxID=39947 RepID=Q5VMT3_ORYSJ|nr:hypothetical protein [Oryza sativa Japonica Group]BAD69242.1 hypothetical protein [Oryza sativa Japonica Group]